MDFQLIHLVGIGGDLLDGFQLNIKWPQRHHLETVKQKFPHLQIVLQLGKRAMREVPLIHQGVITGKLEEKDASPEAVAEAVAYYGDSIDYVLIDPSGGNAEAFTPDLTAQQLLALEQTAPHCRAGVAGGLSATSLEAMLWPLLRSYPLLCWDAEGGLHDGANLHMDKVGEYVEKSWQMIQKVTSPRD